MNVDPEVLQYVHQYGAFKLGLVRTDEWLEHDRHLPVHTHKTVLAPLLSAAKECWVYDISAGTPVEGVARSLLTKSQGKYAVRTSGDPISGFEYFWNVSGGKRGSVVILLQEDSLDWDAIIRNALGTLVSGNIGAAHTPSAIRYAKRRVREEGLVACCLPRNNGFQWLDVIARPSFASVLFGKALEVLPYGPQ